MNHWKNSMWVFKQVSLSNFAWIFSDMSKNLKDCGQDLSNLYDYILLAFRIKILTFSKKLLFLILYRVSLLLKKAMATHSITLAWRIPWTEEPSGLQSMGSLRVWHDWVTSLSLFTFMHWRRKWQPTPAFLPGESQGRRSLEGCPLWGRTESDTTEAT